MVPPRDDLLHRSEAAGRPSRPRAYSAWAAVQPEAPSVRSTSSTVLIGPAYFGTGYVSWAANVLLGTERSRDGVATFAVPIVATFIMVGWDVCLDPGSSTINRIYGSGRTVVAISACL